MDVSTKFIATSLRSFLDELDSGGYNWIAKRLSGNDTGLTGGHQVGVYFPRRFFEENFREICTSSEFNPSSSLHEVYFVSHNQKSRNINARYYNSKFFPDPKRTKKYDEFRVTKWGGKSSPVQNPENTGAVFILGIKESEERKIGIGWVSSSPEEENIIEEWLGFELEPGHFWGTSLLAEFDSFEKIPYPVEWNNKFPSGEEIFKFVQSRLPIDDYEQRIDDLLLKRRQLEFEIFEQIERNHLMPRISSGFKDVATFIKLANSVTNRRKSRTGGSLELNLASIFTHKKLKFERQVVTENRKKPDFIFPSGSAYHDNRFPVNSLKMLASKTNCKDRWRQVINEANRIKVKHLFTLQEGVSVTQLEEMHSNHIRLVTPRKNIRKFPISYRSSILDLHGFIEMIRESQLSI